MAWIQDSDGNWAWEGGAASDYTDPGTTVDPSVNYDITSQSGPSTTADIAPPPAGAVSSSGGNWLDAAGKILGPILTTLGTPWLNNLQSGGQLAAGRTLLENAGSKISNLQVPNLASLIPELKLQVQQGLMTPAQATAALQEASQMQNVQSDVGSLAGQRENIARLGQIANNAGLTDADRAILQATINTANANASQQRGAALNRLQQQGAGSSGAALAADLTGGQTAANTGAMAGAEAARNAQARALAALGAQLQGNQTLNTTQFQQAADKAKAQDVVNQFNTAAKNTIAMQNAANQQQANLNNFNTANQIAGANTTIQNTQAMLPYQAAKDTFTAGLSQATNQGNIGVNAGKALIDQGNKQATNTAGATTGVTQGSGSTSGGSSGGSSGGGTDWGSIINAGKSLWDLFSDEDLKTNKKPLTDDEVDEMMGNITAYKYRYKGNKGNSKGVMAQDVEKGEMGDAVIDTPAGKMLKGNEAMGHALAALANMNQRVRNLEGKK